MRRLLLVSLGVLVLLFGVTRCGSFMAELASWDPHGELRFTPLVTGWLALMVGAAIVALAQRQRKP